MAQRSACLYKADRAHKVAASTFIWPLHCLHPHSLGTQPAFASSTAGKILDARSRSSAAARHFPAPATLVLIALCFLGVSYMLLSALQTRTAAARTLATRAGRSTLSSTTLRRPPVAGEATWEHPYSRRAVQSRAAMPGLRSIEKGRKADGGCGRWRDELKLPPTDATSGFPDHPHRGFETCSIMLSGKMEHSDHVGNHGVIGAGGVQWMTAGRGIIHSEMPVVTDDKLLHGFQLWINLPADKKMVKPHYQDYQASDIPIVEKDGVKVRVMAGESYGAMGPVLMRNPGTLLDVHLAPGATFEQNVPEEWNGFCYVYEGSGKIGGTKVRPQQNAVMGKGDKLVASDAGAEGLKFLLVAGQPIGEPIVQYGPFVMNTEKEIQQAFKDYQSGKFVRPGENVWVADE